MIKNAIITWCGIVGAIFTVFSNLQSAIDFADWARLIANLWGDAVDITVARFFGVFDVRIDETASMMTAMAIFVSAIALGSYLQNATTKEEPSALNFKKLLSVRTLVAVGLYLCLPVVLIVLSIAFHADEIITSHSTEIWLFGNLLYMSSIVIGLSHWPRVFAVYVAYLLRLR